MRRIRFAATMGLLPLALMLVVAPLRAQAQQQGSPIDDLLKRAQDAYNDLNFPRADSLARQVLALGRTITVAQRTRALTVIAAAAYPDDPPAQRRSVALATLRQIVRTNLGLKLPQELTWPGLDSLVDEAKRTTFGLEVSGDTQQVVAGPNGMAQLRVRGSRPGKFLLTIMPTSGEAAAVVDSTAVGMTGEFRFSAMRAERPIFSTGGYSIIVTGIDSVSHDTVTVRYTANVEAPALEFVVVPTKMDSSKLLPERTRRFGAKSILPAVLVGGVTFALASTLHPPGNIQTEAGADSKGAAMAGVVALSTIAAGYLDRGRSIPANIAANKAYGAAFQKSIADAQAENRRRIAEYKTTLHLDLEVR